MTAGVVEVAPHVGERAPEKVLGPLTPTDIVRYAGASGDLNPLHHDDAFARAAGFPGVFSIGMFQAGVLAAYAASWLGAERVRRFRCRFRELVWPGDTLTCSGAVQSVERDAEGHLVTVELACTTQNGVVAVSAVAEFRFP